MISVIVINRNLAVTIGIGVLIVAAVLGGIFYRQRGAHLALHGSVKKVRTVPMDESSTLLVVDFNVANASAYPMTIRTISLNVNGTDGATAEGVPIAAADVPRMFEYYTALGPQEHQPLREQDALPVGRTLERMTAFRLPIPPAEAEKRKNFRLHLEDSTGAASLDLESR